MKQESKFTFNWGWGIFLFFTSFVVFIFSMVYLTTTVKHDLVTADYYKQEIEFQNKIDMKSNLVNSGAHISVNTTNKEIHVLIPEINNKTAGQAEIHFYRASDASKDLKLNNHQDGLFIVPNSQLTKGEYIIKAQWECNGKKYYEESIFVMP